MNSRRSRDGQRQQTTNTLIGAWNRLMRMLWYCLFAGPMVMLTACAVKDSEIAQRAQRRFIGMSEVDLQSCLGAPDEHSSFDSTKVLTYYATSTSSTNFTLPVGGLGIANG